MKEKVAIIDSLGAHGSSHHFYLFGQAKGLSKSGVNVSIYTNNVTKDPNYEGVKFYQFYKDIFGGKSKFFSGIRYVFGSISSLFHARFNSVKICHYHLFHVNILVFFDFILSKILGMKVVYTIHDVVSFENARSSDRLSNWIYKRANKIITHNKFSKEIFRGHYKNINTEIDIIPHGNYVPFLKIKNDKILSRNYLRIPQEKKVLLFFGMIKKVKGLDVLLQSFSKVIDVNSDIILLIAGKPWQHDFSYYQQIIDKNNLTEHIILHPKFIPHDDVEHYYSASDLVVLPYTKIYQSGVLMMALSYGSPALVSDLPPIKEIISDNVNGFLFKSADVNDLAEKLIIILSDKQNLERVRENGKTLINTKFSWDMIGSLTKKAYGRL